VREADLVRQFDAIAAADANAGGGPLADAVEGDDGGLVERRRKERAGGVRLVVIGKDVAATIGPAEPFAQRPRPCVRKKRTISAEASGPAGSV